MIEDDRFEIKVVQYNKEKDSVYIGDRSPLGNPFPMNADESKRDEVCDRYEKYFYEKLAQEDREIMSGLGQLVKQALDHGYVKLGCFCAPRRCHGDTIASYLETILNPH